MADFGVDPERITVFRLDDRYLFSHYFEREDIFDALEEYYSHERYRFEVPADELDEVRDRLEDEYYELRVVEDPEPYCVVTGKYEPHTDVLRNPVEHWERRGHRFFVLPDHLAVREAVERGATPVAETDMVLGI